MQIDAVRCGDAAEGGEVEGSLRCEKDDMDPTSRFLDQGELRLMKENINIIEFITGILRDLPEFEDLSTWAIWFIVLKAIFGLPMDDAEFEIFKKLTGREERPESQFKTAWILAGRRSGKSFISAIILVYLAIFRKWKKGKHGVLMCLATDRDQAKVVFQYCCDLLELPILKPYVSRILSETIELKNGLEIGVHTCSYRNIRGRRILACVADEITFWTREISDPQEVIRALKPALFENPDSLLLAISTVYARYGITFDVFAVGYGKDEKDRVIFRAGTLDLNPTYPQEVIDQELAVDPAGASAEYLSEFRSDRESYLSGDVIDAAVIRDRFELEPQKKIRFFAFVDPSGGSRDSMTLGIAHREGKGAVVLDCLREARPPFNPDLVVKDFALIVKSYGLHSVTGDRYSGEWVKQSFRNHGVEYRNAELTKSELYLAFIPLAMAKRVELLDNERMLRQLRQLERRTGGAKDVVDHPPNSHDDLINSAVGALVLAAEEKARGYFAVAPRSMLE